MKNNAILWCREKYAIHACRSNWQNIYITILYIWFLGRTQCKMCGDLIPKWILFFTHTHQSFGTRISKYKIKSTPAKDVGPRTYPIKLPEGRYDDDSVMMMMIMMMMMIQWWWWLFSDDDDSMMMIIKKDYDDSVMWVRVVVMWM